jgi:hypothetical protein
MPRVPQSQRQVATQPQPGPRRGGVSIPQLRTPQITATPSPESFGAGVGRELAGLGAGIYAEEQRQRDEVFQEEKRRQDTTASLDKDRQFGEWILEVLDNPQSGLLQKRGKDAFGIHEKAYPEFEKRYGELLSELSNDDQKDIFLRQAHSRRQNFRERITDHEGREYRAFAETSMAAGIANSIAGAAANFEQPEEIGVEAERIKLRIWNYGQDNGKGAEWITQQTTAALTKLHQGVIDRMLTAGQDINARTYYSVVKEDVAGDARAEIEKDLVVSSAAGEAQRLTARIVQKIAPDTKLSDLHAEVDKLPEQHQDKVRQAVTTRFNVLKAERDEAVRAASAEAKAVIDSLEQNITNWLRVNPGKMPSDAVPAHVLDQLPRETQSALISFSKSLLPGERKIETDPGTYRRLRLLAAADPDAFLRENLINQVNRLGTADWQEMVKLQADIVDDRRKGSQKAEPALDSIRTNTQIIESSLRAIGTDPDDKLNKARVDQLWKAVDSRVIQFQRDNSKKPGPDDIQKFVDELLIEAVPEDKPWFGFNTPAKRVFEVIQPGEIIATNPQTKEVLVLRDGKWVKP